MNPLNWFHTFAVVLAVVFIVAKAKIDHRLDYKKVAIRILAAGALIVFSALLARTGVFQNTVIKGALFVLLPVALYTAYRVKPDWFTHRANIIKEFLLAVILVMFSIAVV